MLITNAPLVNFGVPASILLALFIGKFCRSAISRYVFLSGGMVFGVAYLLILIFGTDCLGHPFIGYKSCATFPDFLAQVVSKFNELATIAYLTATAPIFLISMAWEVWIRRQCELTAKCNFRFSILSSGERSFYELFAEYFCGRLIPQTLTRRGVEAVAYRLQVSVCKCRRIRLARQVSTEAVVGILNGTFLPRCLRIAEPRIRTKTVLHMLPRTELCSAIKCDRLAGMGRERRQAINQAFHHGFRMSVRVLQNECKSAYALNQ